MRFIKDRLSLYTFMKSKIQSKRICEEIWKINDVGEMFLLTGRSE